VPLSRFEEEVSGTKRSRDHMRKITTRILGATSLAGFAAAATLALAPAAHADTVGSPHTGGVNVAMGDGSVRFVSQSIDLSTWRAIGTQTGGEVVSDF
jgi:prepilin-type processing-associated H-X9-DG protein